MALFSKKQQKEIPKPDFPHPDLDLNFPAQQPVQQPADFLVQTIQPLQQNLQPLVDPAPLFSSVHKEHKEHEEESIQEQLKEQQKKEEKEEIRKEKQQLDVSEQKTQYKTEFPISDEVPDSLPKLRSQQEFELANEDKIRIEAHKKFDVFKPLFIRTEHYKDVLSYLDILLSTISESVMIAKDISELKALQDNKYSEYFEALESIERKLLAIDRTIFKEELL